MNPKCIIVSEKKPDAKAAVKDSISMTFCKSHSDRKTSGFKGLELERRLITKGHDEETSWRLSQLW